MGWVVSRFEELERVEEEGVLAGLDGRREAVQLEELVEIGAALALLDFYDVSLFYVGGLGDCEGWSEEDAEGESVFVHDLFTAER